MDLSAMKTLKMINVEHTNKKLMRIACSVKYVTDGTIGNAKILVPSISSTGASRSQKVTLSGVSALTINQLPAKFDDLRDEVSMRKCLTNYLIVDNARSMGKHMTPLKNIYEKEK